MNNASYGNIAPSADAAPNSEPLTTHVDSSEIQIDPTTHLPFLKNVHFNDFDISDVLKKPSQRRRISDPHARPGEGDSAGA